MINKNNNNNPFEKKNILYYNIDFLTLKLCSSLMLPFLQGIVSNSATIFLDDNFSISFMFKKDIISIYKIYHVKYPNIPLCNISSIQWQENYLKNWVKIDFYWEFFSLIWKDYIDYILLLLNYPLEYTLFRLDFCVDLSWYAIKQDFYNKYKKNEKFKKEISQYIQPWWYLNYIWVKYSGMFIRIYDKILDIQAKKKNLFDNRYKKYLSSKKQISRFEIQLDRKILKKFVCKNVNDIFSLWEVKAFNYLNKYFDFWKWLKNLSYNIEYKRAWKKDLTSEKIWKMFLSLFYRFIESDDLKLKYIFVKKILPYILKIINDYENNKNIK